MNCLEKIHPSSLCSCGCSSFILLHGADRPRDLLDYLPIDATVYSSPFRQTHGHLLLLDLNIYRSKDGSLEQTIYRKLTHKNLCLNVSSHHHPDNEYSVLST